MSEFQELIKSFGKSRDYVRDFFVYGFKSRQDFTSEKKSARTYDDERRRITSWLGDYVEEETTESAGVRGKNISLQMDSNLLDENPLFAVWKTKSFTDNDIVLHFSIFDILHEPEIAFTANEIADILSTDYALAVDTQMVRRKLNEYVKEGLVISEKQGKTVLYRRGITFYELVCESEECHISENLSDAVSLMQLDIPFGYVGSTILDVIDEKNTVFRVKHSFPSFTLEDEILYQILEAKKDYRMIQLEVQNSRNENIQTFSGIPLKIMVSVRTGRRYVCFYQKRKSRVEDKNRFRFICFRLDQIKKVSDYIETNEELPDEIKKELGELNPQKISETLNSSLRYVWGVSFFGMKTKVKLTLSIDEKYEDFIIQRLKREGKDGVITKLEDNIFCYEKIVFDPVEMYPWLRTFIGRIVDIRFYTLDEELNEKSENRKLRSDFLKDIREMTSMYQG